MHELRGRKRILDARAVKFMKGFVSQKQDIYLDEIQQKLSTRLGLTPSLSPIWLTLKREGYSLKKVLRTLILPVPSPQPPKAAIERNEDRRVEFMNYVGHNLQAEQLVFVDGSSFDRRTPYRRRGWAVTGQRAIKKVFFVRGQRCVCGHDLSNIY
ncbi:hypothetical protein L218DRAFT_877869 [Marasmius fiardii PR-910]|nr:hypothetical protein L218DRAFT_877869 [Marasmius fiardii PR-910]